MYIVSICLSPHNCVAFRLEWQKLQVVYKFIEHVILENTAENHELLAYLVPYSKRLIIVMKTTILYYWFTLH